MREIFIRRADHQAIRITGAIQIGRDSACPICVPEARVSRLHATLLLKDDFLYVRDEDSSNGTYVNGVRIFRQTLLQHGDRLRVGDTTFIAEYGRDQDPEAQEAEDQAPTFPVSVKPPAPAQPPAETPSPTPAMAEIDELDEYPEAPQAAEEPAPSETDADEPHQPDVPQTNKIPQLPALDLKRLRWGGIAVGGAALLLAFVWTVFAVLSGPPETEPLTSASGASFDAEEALETTPPTPIVPVEEPVEASIPATPQGGAAETGYPGGVRVHFPDGVTPDAYHLSIAEDTLPDLPAPIEALSPGITLRIEGEKPLVAPLMISLPLDESARDLAGLTERTAVYQFVAGNWIFLGGIPVDNELRFWMAESGSVRAGYLPDAGKTSQYRPFKIVNTSGMPLTARPWKWWLPLDYTLPVPGNLARMLSRVMAVDDGSSNDAIGYFSLPYGSYSAWCFSWRDSGTQQERSIVREFESALTPYSCSWEAFGQGACEPEGIVVDITSDTPAEPGGCENAPVLPAE